MREITSDRLKAPLVPEVVAAHGQPVDCLGTLNLTFNLGFCSVADRVTVINSVDGIFLAWYVARDLVIIPDNYSTPLTCNIRAMRSQVNFGQATVV